MKCHKLTPDGAPQVSLHIRNYRGRALPNTKGKFKDWVKPSCGQLAIGGVLKSVYSNLLLSMAQTQG